MLVKILGTRGEIEASAEGHYRHSGILIDDHLLLDIGEPEYLESQPKAILITHLHPDHAFFMRDGGEVKINVPVFAPEGTKKQEVTVLSAPCELEGYQVTPVPTIHSVDVRSQGYIIQKGSTRVFYSGDLADIEPKNRKLLGKLDMVITEGSFMRKGGMVRKTEDGRRYGHAGVPDLITMFSEYTNHIVLTHFGTWFMKDPVKAKEKIAMFNTADLRVDVAFDGAEYKV